MTDKYIYVCYQADTLASILAITDTEEQAKEVCNQDDDRYIKIELNTNFGRDLYTTNEVATYNVNGYFVQGYDNAKLIQNYYNNEEKNNNNEE